MSPSPRTVTVMQVGPTTRCDVLVASADYREFNRLVGGPDGAGSISMLRLPSALRERSFAAYCDDDAIARGQQPNHFAPQLGHWRLLGPVVVFKDDGMGNEASLSPSDVQFLARYLASPPSAEARQWVLDDQAFWGAHPSGHSLVSFERLDDLFKELGIEE